MSPAFLECGSAHCRLSAEEQPVAATFTSATTVLT